MTRDARFAPIAADVWTPSSARLWRAQHSGGSAMFPISCSRSLLMATLGLAACLAVFGTLPALAGTGGGGDMPWDPLLAGIEQV